MFECNIRYDGYGGVCLCQFVIGRGDEILIYFLFGTFGSYEQKKKVVFKRISKWIRYQSRLDVTTLLAHPSRPYSHISSSSILKQTDLPLGQSIDNQLTHQKHLLQFYVDVCFCVFVRVHYNEILVLSNGFFFRLRSKRTVCCAGHSKVLRFVWIFGKKKTILLFHVSVFFFRSTFLFLIFIISISDFINFGTHTVQCVIALQPLTLPFCIWLLHKQQLHRLSHTHTLCRTQ